MSAQASTMVPVNLMRVTETSAGRGCKGRALFPGHESPDPTDAREVVVDDGRHQHHQYHEAAEQQLLLNLDTEVAPRDAFESHDEDVAAIEDRNRQQVEETEVEAERRHQAEQ